MVAWLRPDDANHARAVTAAKRLVEEQSVLLVTNYVVAETHALLARHLGGAAAALWLDAWLPDMIRAEPADEAAAARIVRTHRDKRWSFCDAVSFAVIERLGLTRAFAYDRHFKQYGKAAVIG